MTETIERGQAEDESTSPMAVANGEARLLPLTLDEAKAFVMERMNVGQITLKTLHDSVGYSKATWSNFFAGKYDDPTGKVAAALIRFVDEWRASETLVPITSFKVILRMLGLVGKDNELAVFYGKSGTGKTEAARHYARTNDGVIYYRCNNAITPGELLLGILKKLTDSYNNYANLNQRILDIQFHLRRQPRLIILDEADQLTVRTLEMVRTIYDDGACGLVLLGEPGILDLLQHGRQMRVNLVRLYSRVGYKCEIKPPTIDEIKAIIEHRGYELSKPMIGEIREWIRDAGELRRLAKLLDRAEDIRLWNDLPSVNDEAVRGAYNLLIGKA